MIETDVLVIGAGPAGSTAAKHAALNGANVILIDKKSEIGTPKRCAEGIYETGLKTLGIEPDERWIAQKIDGGVIVAPDGNTITFDSEILPEHGYIIERKVFDKYMAMDAARAGAEIMIKTLATGIERNDDFVIVHCERLWESFDIKTKIVIAADGPESHIGQMFGVNTITKSGDMMSGIQFEMCGVKPYRSDLIEMHLGQFAEGGYGWVFPKGEDIANVGIGVIAKNADKQAYEYLKDFVKKCPTTQEAQAIELNVGGDPIGGFVEKIYDNNLLICGDAAGQVDALTGGGIIAGMAGGMCAGKVAGIAIKKGDYSKQELKHYEKDYDKISYGLIPKLTVAREVFASLSDDDFNKLIATFKEVDFKNASNSELIKTFFKISPRVTLKFTKLFKVLFK